MTGPDLNEDAVIACADLTARSGATEFELGYLRDGVPPEEAGWYAQAIYRGARIMTDEHRSPSLAALALAEQLLTGATCKCGRPVTLTTRPDSCRWRLAGPRWEPGCTAPAIRISGKRGDVAAINEAMNRAARRRAKRHRS